MPTDALGLRSAVAGREAALIFVSDLASSVPRPVREFKTTASATLSPGETRTLSVRLPARAFAFWNPAQQAWVVEAGEFRIEVGPDSQHLSLSTEIAHAQRLSL